MKSIHILTAIIMLTATTTLLAQDVNYRKLDDTRHLVSATIAIQNGTSYGISYGYVWNTSYTPVVIGTEFSQPFGENQLDDWKWKTSVQTEVFRKNSFSVVFKPMFVWRHFESNLATMQNFGADLTLNAGYVRSNWGVLGVVGFDKSIATRVKHHLLKDFYPNIKDGWYEQGGGNYKFALRVQGSYRTWNAFLTAGKQFGQDFSDNPTLPFFTEVSIQKHLR